MRTKHALAYFGMPLAIVAIIVAMTCLNLNVARAACTTYSVVFATNPPPGCNLDFPMSITATFNGGAFNNTTNYNGPIGNTPGLPLGATTITSVTINGTLVAADPNGIRIPSACTGWCMKVVVDTDPAGCQRIIISWHTC